jgi:hypothetical protein
MLGKKWTGKLFVETMPCFYSGSGLECWIMGVAAQDAGHYNSFRFQHNNSNPTGKAPYFSCPDQSEGLAEPSSNPCLTSPSSVTS